MRLRLSCLAVLLGTSTSCAAGVPVAGAPPDSPSTGAVPERVVTAYLAAYNRHDIRGMLRLADTAIVWLTIAGDSLHAETRGATALQRALEAYFQSTPTARSDAEALMSIGPWVTVRERAHWLSASGHQSQAALAVYEVRDGRIRRVWYYPAVR